MTDNINGPWEAVDSGYYMCIFSHESDGGWSNSITLTSPTTIDEHTVRRILEDFIEAVGTATTLIDFKKTCEFRAHQEVRAAEGGSVFPGLFAFHTADYPWDLSKMNEHPSLALPVANVDEE